MEALKLVCIFLVIVVLLHLRRPLPLAITGGVVEFTDSGCSLTPQLTEEADTGEVAYQAAPGAENEADNVLITYQEDCIFQRAIINAATGEAVITDITKAEVKKQSQVTAFGDMTTEKQVSASKIIITQFE